MADAQTEQPPAPTPEELAAAEATHDRNAKRLEALGYTRVERPQFVRPDRWECETDGRGLGGFSVADDVLFDDFRFNTMFGEPPA